MKCKIIRYGLSILLSMMVMGCAGEESGMSERTVETVDLPSEMILENSEATEMAQLQDTSEGTVEASSPSAESSVIAETQPLLPEEETTEPPSLSLCMVGDILLHTPVEESAKQEDGTYNFDAIFANITDEIQAADLALVNQEVIIGGEELGISGYPAFNAPYAIGDALVESGFDVICHATNHALDKGKKGLLNCINYWDNNYPDIAVLGIHDSQESQDNIYYYEKNDIRIAILNYTYGTNGIALPQDMPYAVDMLEKETVLEDIAEAEENADFTIVCPHWGTEYLLNASSEQEKWTELFAANGVDLVLGTHPHVIEPIEWVTDAESGHSMLVYYSLGNFVNWTSSSGEGIANRMVGGLAQVTLSQDEQGTVTITDYTIEPLVCHLQEGINGVTVYPLSEYTEELALQNCIRNQDPAFSKEYCEKLCAQVWGEILP